jgi:hypothetical protein
VVAQNGQSIETGNAGHTRQRIKTKQKQTKNEHNVRWTLYRLLTLAHYMLSNCHLVCIISQLWIKINSIVILM